jgi:hypothetical protein
MNLDAGKTLLLIQVNHKFDEHKKQIYKNLIKYLSVNDLDQVLQWQSNLEFAIHMELRFIDKLSTMSDSAVAWYRKNEEFQLDLMFTVLVGVSDI